MQPYRTCKLFGALRVVLGIQDAIALIHSPRGCVYNLRYLLGVRGAKTNRILTTEMDEKDVIFGGEVRLKRAIMEVDRKYKPNLIAILTSCASSIIGEDIELVVRDVDVNAKLLPIYSGGFEGDQIDGYKEALKKVVDLIVEGADKDSSLNLLAVYRYGWDLEEVKRLISLVGVRVNATLTAKTTLKEIEGASKASLNVIMCEASGFDAARIMEKRFGIPYLHPLLPVGIRATESFITTISESVGKKVSNMPLKEKKVAEMEIEKIKSATRGKKVCIISGASRIAPLTLFVTELEMEPVIISIDRVGETTTDDLNSIIKQNNLNPKILIEPEFDDVFDSIAEEKPDLIVGGLYEEVLSKSFGIPLCDVMHGEKKTMGFRGAITLAMRIKEAILSGK